MINIAIVGDIHLHFNEVDAIYFNQSDYDLILFVGDLSNYIPRRGLVVARHIARIQKPVLFIPGNHDATNIFQLAAEIWQKPWLARGSWWGQKWWAQALENKLGTAVSTGYSTHHFQIAGLDFDVIAARPFSMGGPNLSFLPYMKKRYGISSLAQSKERLCQCIDQSQSNRLIFLAHNGPTGLGQAPTDIWGCDFRPDDGDFGDPDLEEAVDYARSQEKEVVAVIAGHLHHRTKSGQQRQWLVEQDGTQYVNAACVPRIFAKDGQVLRHHVRLVLRETAVTIEEIFVE
jgi:uncharacterized protein (TIGR04168 family)